jgi:hypothetical protein
MGGPPWVADILAVVMLLVAVYCAVRLVLAPVLHRRIERDIDLVHLVMGITMAGMLVPGLNPWAGHTWNTLWEMVFAVITVYFLVRGAPGVFGPDTATGHYLPHAVHSVAMVYMFLGMAAMSAMPAPAATPPAASPAMPGMNTMPAMPGIGPVAAVPAAGPAAAPEAATLALVLGLFMVGYAVLLINRIPTPGTTSRDPEPAALVTAFAAAHMVSNADPAGTAAEPTLDQTTPSKSTPAQLTRTSLLAPHSATIYKIAMSITMAYMLVNML